MSSLPLDLTPDILSNLPVKDLLRFRCIYSSWCSLIDSPYFSKLHLSRSQKTRSNHFLIYKYTEFKSLQFDSLEEAPEFLQSIPVQSRDQVEIVGSCNGVLVLYNGSEGDVSLLNPSTRKLRKLPSSKITAPKPGLYRERLAYGFGYDSVMDDYKLVRIALFSTSVFSKAEIFSLKMNTWKEIQCPFIINTPATIHSRSDALVNNALHWLSYSQPPNIMVVGLDLAKEEFYFVPNYPDCGFAMFHHVGVLGGCLSMSSNCFVPPASSSLHVWVMKDYRVKESWSKLFLLTLNPPARPYLPFAIPIAYSRDHRRILLNYMGHLAWYDLTAKTVHLVNDSDHCLYMSNLCMGSLVALDWRKDKERH